MAKKSGKSSSAPDERFAGLQNDPRFQLPQKKSLKSDIDARFKSALDTDERFKSETKTDKYGRKIREKNAKKQLEKYYHLESDESESDSGASVSGKRIDRMRGQGMSDLSSSDESDSDEEPEIEHRVDEYDLGRSEVLEGDASRRLAVVNLDWDNVRAVDLLATFTGFVPKGGLIESVKILPSEYGKKRMAEEELNGPSRELFDKTEDPKELEDEEDPEDEYSSSKLRRYQLQRLQYYYAVVTCDSVATASAIYDSCDGTEIESSANFFDLRYVPDDMEFEDTPKDESTKLPVNYEPRTFSTDALQHSKVRLTWDSTPKERQQFSAKAFNSKNLEDMDMQAYLASDSDSDREAQKEKFRTLLASEEESGSDSDVDMQVTFNPVLENKSAKIEIAQDKPATDNENMSTIAKYRLKEKERKRQRYERSQARRKEAAGFEEKDEKADLELIAMDDELSNTATGKHDKRKMTKTKQKRLAMEEAEQNFDLADPRFQGLFENPDFAIDATAPQFKKTKAMETVLKERRSRQAQVSDEPELRKRKTETPVDNVEDIVSKLKRRHK